MPLYEYVCEKCDKQDEVFQGVNDPHPICCEQSMKRQIGGTFIRKGAGIYSVDVEPSTGPLGDWKSE
jgi:putative FmdB family regulatory protein